MKRVDRYKQIKSNILQESAFITEVYHINGEGEDSGVVYSEMQRADNMGEVLAYNELRRAIYPGKCCYKSISGGTKHHKLHISFDRLMENQFHSCRCLDQSPRERG